MGTVLSPQTCQFRWSFRHQLLVKEPSHQDGFNGGKNLEAVLTERGVRSGDKAPGNRQNQVICWMITGSCFDGRRCSNHFLLKHFFEYFFPVSEGGVAGTVLIQYSVTT